MEGSGLGRGPENFFVYGPNQLVGLIRNKLIVSFVRRLAFIPVGSEGEACVASAVRGSVAITVAINCCGGPMFGRVHHESTYG